MSDDSTRFLKEEAKRLVAENRELHAELSALCESVQALARVYTLTQGVSADTDVLKLLSDILDACLKVLKASDGSLMLVDEKTGDLVFTVVRGGTEDRLVGYHMPQDKGIAGWAVAHREPQVVLDVRRDPRFFSKVDETFGFNTRSMVCVPVCLDDGRVLGVIEILNKVSDREFTQEDLNLMLIAAQLAATAMRRAERFAEAQERRASLLSRHSPPKR